MTPADREVLRLAAGQHGVFTRFQALKAGLSYQQVRSRLDSGFWEGLSRRVYGLPEYPDSFERRLMTAILAHPRAIAAGESAARLHGFSGYDDGPIEILVPLTGDARTDAANTVRSTFFNTIARVEIRRIVSTSAAETVLTLAARVSRPRLEWLLDEVLSDDLATIEEFHDILLRCQGGRVKGVRNLRALVNERSDGTDAVSTSVLESRLYRLLNESGIPDFVPQFEIPLFGRVVRVDAFVPEWDLVVEADGRRWHSKKRDFEKDRARDNELQMLGHRVCRFTYRDLTQDYDGALRTLQAFRP